MVLKSRENLKICKAELIKQLFLILGNPLLTKLIFSLLLQKINENDIN